jgi:phage FluMu gp28-like protein
MPDAVELGLLDIINETRDANFTPEQFIADCQARSGSEEVYQQSYLCNPLGAASASIVEWSAIERCRADYPIERLHLENDQVLREFGEFNPSNQLAREQHIETFLRQNFPSLLTQHATRNPELASCSEGLSPVTRHPSPLNSQPSTINFRLGFDVAASGQGDLAVIYIDQAAGEDLWLRALFSCRTEDWHFLQTVLFQFMRRLRSAKAAGDSSGLGRQICWEAGRQFGSRFESVNFSSKKHDLGFALMNQLATVRKRFPRSDQDIAADYFALRKIHTGAKWVFTEGRNNLNLASHCDIAWAAALATFAHTNKKSEAWAMVC